MNKEFILRVYPKPSRYVVKMQAVIDGTMIAPQTLFMHIAWGTPLADIWLRIKQQFSMHGNTYNTEEGIIYAAYDNGELMGKTVLTESLLYSVFQQIASTAAEDLTQPKYRIDLDDEDVPLCFELVRGDMMSVAALNTDSMLSVVSMANRLSRKLAHSQNKLGLTNGHRYLPDSLAGQSGNGKVFVDADDCITALKEHLAKGDILDSIAYLMFLAEIDHTDDKSMRLVEAFFDGETD